MNGVRVGLVQVNVDFEADYLPYSAGLLQAYACTDPAIREGFTFLPAVFRRIPDVQRHAEALSSADIVGFSAYVWNMEYSLELARCLKARRPEMTIVFGGPHVPDQAEPFLRAHPEVDFAIAGEGEVPFRAFLRAQGGGDLAQVPSLRFIDGQGRFQATGKAPRLKGLDEIPSPYLTGVFDPLLGAADGRWNVLWETNRGCPFSCTFCDWGSATASKVHRFAMERLEAEIAWFARHQIEYVMCVDANFGIFERDVQIAQRLAASKRETGYPKVLGATYTKNATERSYTIARILSEAGLIRGYTVSTQSMDDTTLVNVKRQNISLKTFTTLQARFNRDRLATYTDLIIGLPGETYESFTRGVAQVVATGQHSKIYFIILSMLPNAPMADPVYRQTHGIETVLVPQRNLHEKVKLDEPTTERQELVIATRAMDRADWRRTLGFAWMCSLVYFNKLLQIPMAVLGQLSGRDVKTFTEAFLFEEDRPAFPFLSRINRLFREKAQAIQQGEIEYVVAPGWLDVYWTPDKLAFMEACRDAEPFYAEARGLLAGMLEGRWHDLLDDALVLNRALLRSPFQTAPGSLDLRFNVYELYLGLLDQHAVPLRTGRFEHRPLNEERWPTTDDWCRQVVWFANKTGRYLSPCDVNEVSAPSTVGGHAFEPAACKPYLFG